LPAGPVPQLLQCQRWGVCDEGTAALCVVDLKTVHRFHAVAARRAQLPHQQGVPQVAVQGVQWDAAHAQLRPRQAEWLQTALALGIWCRLGVDFGPRPPDTAAALLAPIIARARELPLLLPDGWKASPAARLQVVGVV